MPSANEVEEQKHSSQYQFSYSSQPVHPEEQPDMQPGEEGMGGVKEGGRAEDGNVFGGSMMMSLTWPLLPFLLQW